MHFPFLQNPASVHLGNQQASDVYNKMSQLPLGSANPSALMQPSGPFYFQEKKGRINWRDISRLNLGTLLEGSDFKTLETQLSNITFAKLDEEDFERFSDSTLLKLFKLSQLSLEYLMNTQNYLANQTQTLDHVYRLSEEKVTMLAI
mgnify:CR=1 FL=1